MRNLLGVVVVAGLSAHAHAASRDASAKEDYVRAPMPPGFQVIVTELEGPVFADARGHTLYSWPRKPLRNGDIGEVQEKPICTDQPYRENSGMMSPYPAGLELPEVDTRPSCTAMWPPAFAETDAKPVGKWTIVDRSDGRKQWAYNGWSLYLSALDAQPGDVIGGSAMQMYDTTDSGANRKPAGPDANVPPQFAVHTTMMGRLMVLNEGWSVYSYDGDSRNKSNCDATCLDGWAPILAANYAHPVGEWATFERAPGVRQWTFRGMPVYRHLEDLKYGSLDGGDVPRWHNIYTQKAPAPPKGLTLNDSPVGIVLGDSQGKTIYRYVCTDDAFDQLPCDVPESPQAYRFTVCGGGDVDRCNHVFPYVIAPVGAKSGNQVWGTMDIDPKTGKRVNANQTGALHVWAYRGRPVYTFAGFRGYGDTKPGDVKANDWGEFNAQRHGFHALVYRDIHASRDE